jgi:dTDP-4-dehydrorhamnose reductase
MRNSRILIFGRIGQVGWELRHKLACLGQFSTVEYPEVDFTNSDSIRSALRIEPAVIVNAVAYTAVDKAESEPQRVTAINATGLGVVAEEARRLGGLLVHYATDYVFDGSKLTPWVETDAPNPLLLRCPCCLRAYLQHGSISRLPSSRTG